MFNDFDNLYIYIDYERKIVQIYTIEYFARIKCYAAIHFKLSRLPGQNIYIYIHISKIDITVNVLTEVRC